MLNGALCLEHPKRITLQRSVVLLRQRSGVPPTGRGGACAPGQARLPALGTPSSQKPPPKHRLVLLPLVKTLQQQTSGPSSARERERESKSQRAFRSGASGFCWAGKGWEERHECRVQWGDACYESL